MWSERPMLMALAGLLAVAATLNLIMLVQTGRRWARTRVDPREGPTRAKIAAMTLRRALGLEVAFLLIQMALLAHTIYLIRVGPERDRPFWTMVQRGFVSVMVSAVSVTDFFARTKIRRLMEGEAGKGQGV